MGKKIINNIFENLTCQLGLIKKHSPNEKLSEEI